MIFTEHGHASPNSVVPLLGPGYWREGSSRARITRPASIPSTHLYPCLHPQRLRMQRSRMANAEEWVGLCVARSCLNGTLCRRCQIKSHLHSPALHLTSHHCLFGALPRATEGDSWSRHCRRQQIARGSGQHWECSCRSFRFSPKSVIEASP